jgi:putative transferase (TIGR04331 family)
LFLATTADQRFWKKDDKIIFLGEWCKLFNQKHIWSKLNYQVLPYHWQSRDEYFKAHIYLEQLYEQWLPILTKNLNIIHNEDHSDRYWRVILSPWLYYFIQTFYDRYLSIRRAIDSQEVKHTWVPNLSKTYFTPNDFNTFTKWQSQDGYNLYLYSWLIKAINIVPAEIKNYSTEEQQVPFRRATNLKSWLKFGLNKLLTVLPQSHGDILLVSLYARKQDLVKLQLTLGQFPKFYTGEISQLNTATDLELRNKLDIPLGKDEFTSLLSRLISSQIPKSYLEDYSELKKESGKHFPKKLKVIVTANTHYGNEEFKIGCADRLEKGARLVGMPHGSNYGTALWSSNETHEKKIADHYFSWGWEDKKGSKVIPLSSIQLAGTQKKISFDPQGRILWLGMSRPRYFNWMISAPRGCEMLEYIEDQKVFLTALRFEIKEILKMRLFPVDYEWNVMERLMEDIPDLHFDNRKESLLTELCKSRLCISSYNASPILETMSANFPTIAFWNYDQWELRDSAIPYFEELVHVGIFHKNPLSAAKKVNEIYRDPMAWWLLPEVQKARVNFCHQFAHTSSTWLSEWKKELFRIAGK